MSCLASFCRSVLALSLLVFDFLSYPQNLNRQAVGLHHNFRWKGEGAGSLIWIFLTLMYIDDKIGDHKRPRMWVWVGRCSGEIWKCCRRVTWCDSYVLGGIWTQRSAVHVVFTCLDCLFVHSKPGLLYNFSQQCNCGACCKEDSKNYTLLSIVLQLCF